MKTSEQGIAMIRSFEGVKLTPYKDVAGRWTIGVGHLLAEGEGEEHETINSAQADAILRNDLDAAEKAVTDLVRTPISQNEFDALVSFTFNLGRHALQGSTLLRMLNSGDVDQAADQFVLWDKAHVDGKLTQVEGLTRRRMSERRMFVTGHA